MLPGAADLFVKTMLGLEDFAKPPEDSLLLGEKYYSLPRGRSHIRALDPQFVGRCAARG